MRRLAWQRGLAVVAGLLILAGGVCGAEEPAETVARVVPLEPPEQPLDAQAPPSRFTSPQTDALWQSAWKRATTVSQDQGGGIFDMSALVSEGFRSAKKFTSEKFADNDSGSDLQYALAADEAVKQGDTMLLTRMRLVYFINRAFLPQPGAPAKAGKRAKAPAATAALKAPEAAPVKQAAKPKKMKRAAGAAAVAGGLPAEGRVVITAPQAVLDTVTNEGRATGNVTIEIFSKLPGGAAATAEGAAGQQPVAVLSAERLRWRSWNEPWSGATEMAIYAGGEAPGEPDPVVTVKYVTAQADGASATVVVEGRGFVYEVGTYDRPSPKEDEDGRTAGVSLCERNRAIFRRDIRMVTTATAMAALMPFQAAEGPPAPNASAKKGAKPAAPAAPSQTVLTCSGPAVLNMGAVPPAKEGGVSALDLILLARRLEFYNKVEVVKKLLGPEPPAGADIAPGSTDMVCQHLCLQYAAGAMPGPAMLPEYAEAIGDVTMRGTNAPTAAPGEPAPPATPFSVACQRVFYDGLKDNTFLVGDASRPVVVKDEKGDASAQQFCYHRGSQTLTMPQSGPKQLVIKPAALARPQDGAAVKPPAAPPDKDKPGGAFDLVATETIIKWHGPLSREVRRLPVPRSPDRIKEILTLHENVNIDQPGGGLKMSAGKIRLVRNMPGGDVEFLEGIGAADASMGELQAVGETISVELGFEDDGKTPKNLITVTGNRSKGTKATLFTGDSAIRSDRFVIDRQNDKFDSFGGAVAVMKAAVPAAPAPEKPPAAQDAGGLFKGISFDAGGNLYVQCDGEFRQDGAKHVVTITKNVMIRQRDVTATPGQPPSEKRLLADEVTIALEDAPAPVAGAAATPADSFFSGKFKSLDCRGNVELVSPEQVVQCDRLLYEAPPKDSSRLEVDDPENDVRVYMREESSGTRVLCVRKSLTLDGTSGMFTPGGRMVMLPYRAWAPTPRGKETSPGKKKE